LILTLYFVSKAVAKHALPIHFLFAPFLFERRILRSRGFTGCRRRNSRFQKNDKLKRCTEKQTEICAQTECKAEDAIMTDLLLEGESDITDHPDFLLYATCMQRCCARLNGAQVAPLREEEKRRGPSKLPFQSIFEVADQKTVERCDETMCKSHRKKYETLVALTSNYKKLRSSQELKDYKECIERSGISDRNMVQNMHCQFILSLVFFSLNTVFFTAGDSFDSVNDKLKKCTVEQTAICTKTECKAEDAAMTDLLLEGESDIFDHPDFASYATCMQRCCARLNGAAVPPLKEGEKRRGPSKLPFQSIFEVADQKTVERCDETMCKSYRKKYENLVARTSSYKKLRSSQELKDYKECIERFMAEMKNEK
ncbi:hypothetical protein T03_14974, partial [Trichinella britovi]